MSQSKFDSATRTHSMHNVLMLRRDGSMFTGVCSGIAHYLEVDSTLIRVSAIVLSLASPVVVPTYVTLAFVLPQDTSGDASPWFDGMTLVRHLKSGFKEMLKAAIHRDKATFHRAWRQQLNHCSRAWFEAAADR